tara:strand:+ start:118 stop:510 length:393 start_codon:yes stop_codon:yes gene_type:complete
MDAFSSMNVFLADLPSGWTWGHTEKNWAFWVCGGILFLIMCCFIYDGIKNRDDPWWRDQGPMGTHRPKRRRKGGWLANTFLVQLWRNAPPEITTWGKIWRTVLFLGFLVVLIYIIGWAGLLGGRGGFDEY